MINNLVLSEIDKRMKLISSSFGGATELVLDISRSIGIEPPSLENGETEYEVSKLLYNPDITVVISPWSYRFLIAERLDNGTLSDNSAIMDDPYSVYTTSGKLLYSVSSHQGIFGNSVLDKSIISESVSGARYYLQFPTYLGHTRTIQLLVNRASITPAISLPQFKPKPTISETNVRNSIFLKAGQTYRNSAALGNPLFPIRLHMQRSNSAISPTVSSVIENSDTIINFPLDIDDNVIFHPQQSCWIVLTQETPLGDTPIRIGNVAGQGASRLLEVSPSLYFIAASPNEDLNLVRQNLGLISYLPPSPNELTSINITGDLLQ